MTINIQQDRKTLEILTRIAVALEKIAEELKPEPQTPDRAEVKLGVPQSPS